MTPEDKIIAAIDRNTKELQGVGDRIISCSVVLWLPLMLIATIIGCPRSNATPLLPKITYEIGTPPMPPPNPHVQYWHTQYVPGPDGVLPVEVFAPRLRAVMADTELAVVDVPEPTVATTILLGMVLVFMFLLSRRVQCLDSKCWQCLHRSRLDQQHHRRRHNRPTCHQQRNS